jgi:WD40 repeat protein
MRTWSPPDAIVRVAVKTAASMSKAILLPHKGPLIALGDGATIPWYNRTGASGDLQAHDPSHSLVALSATQARFAMYGRDDEVELWSFEPGAINRRLSTKHGAVAALVLSDGARLVAGSRDGTVTEWSTADDTHHELGTIHESIAVMLEVPHTDMIVIAGTSGTLWLANKVGISYLGKEADPLTVAVCSQDSRWLAVGTTQGAVRLYDISTREAVTVLSTRSWIEILSFSPDSSELAIGTENKVTFAAVMRSSIDRAPSPPGVGRARWHEVGHPVRYVSFSRDNKWFAVTCDHGDIWFYRRQDDRWMYRSVGTAKISFGKFSDDSAYFAASDTSGKALLVDMHASAFN